MIVTIGGIPVYDALVTDADTGMLKISLVDDPAVMSNFQKFDAAKRPQRYAIQDEEKRLVRGCIMRADFPIYRSDESIGEYYVIYKADTIRTMAEKYLAEGRQNDVNLMHEDGSDVEGVQMVQYFIKGDGVQVDGFDDCADGSLFGEFHIVNDDIWAEIKAGTYKGFSLEGVFDLQPEQDKDKVESIADVLNGAFSRLLTHKPKTMSRMKRFAAALAKALQEFGNVTTDKGILEWDGGADLEVGDAVSITDVDGNSVAAADGDYKTDDNKVIVVVDGKVAEIKDAEAEVATEMAKVATDKGELLWDGEEDLKAGDLVYILNEAGEQVAADDGDYTTEDGKVIKVAEGKVSEIVDNAAEVSTDGEDAELAKKKKAACSAKVRLQKVRQMMEESFEEKERKMVEAIEAKYPESYPLIVEAGNDYCVADIWDEESIQSKLYRFPVAWNEDGTCSIGEPQEVKWAIVPVEQTEEFKAVKAENDTLKAQVAELKAQPAAKPAHEQVREQIVFGKTGNKGLDRLARIANAK